MEVKVTIKIKDTEIKDLSLEEIKELRDILSKIVDKEKEIVKEYIPYPYPYQPIWTEPYPYRYWYPTVTWDTTNTPIQKQDIVISYCNS